MSLTKVSHSMISGSSVYVQDFGAVGDGVTNDTAAIEAAVSSLTSGQTLTFTPGATYLVSYIWAPNTDSTGLLPGYGHAVGFVNTLNNVTIDGNGCTIKCLNHDIATNGGFFFLLANKSPNLTVKNFYFDMSFTGYKNSSSFYPLAGGVVVFDVTGGSGTQSALCSNFTANNLRFKLYHPNGAFSITTNPYGGDNNNGHKLVSIFVSGDGSATTYATQNRGLSISKIYFEKGHNGYGVWAIAYNSATIKDITANAWIAASYTIATNTYTGVDFVAPARFYQYYCTGLTIDNIQVISLPSAERVGAFAGVCGGVSVDSGLTDRYYGGGSITNCKFLLDSPTAGLGAQNDTGIQCTLSGEVAISNNLFEAWAVAGVVCIRLGAGGSGTGATTFSITGNTANRNVQGPFVQMITGNNVSDATRLIKGVVVSDNNILGWGSEGSVVTFTAGTTFYGVGNIVVSGNIFDGTNSAGALTGTAVNCQGRTANDFLEVGDNIIRYAGTPLQSGTSTVVARDNLYSNNVSTSNVLNYLTNYYPELTTFAAGSSVVVPVTGNYYASYSYIEYSGAGAQVITLVGLATASTAPIRTVGGGNTGYLTSYIIANIK